jgi:hypothetical protein
LQIPDNTADKEVENYEYDYYIYSKSLEYLNKKAKELYHKIEGLDVFSNCNFFQFYTSLNKITEIERKRFDRFANKKSASSVPLKDICKNMQELNKRTVIVKASPRMLTEEEIIKLGKYLKDAYSWFEKYENKKGEDN